MRRLFIGVGEEDMEKLYALIVFTILILFFNGCITPPEVHEKQGAVVAETKTIKQTSEKSGAIPYSATEGTKEWELVSSFAKIRMVYMSPAGLKNKDYIAQILTQLVDKKDIIQVLFFDNKKYTPLDYPMTDEQLLHWKANYNFNPNTGHERFVFIEITNPKASPPDLKEIEANIRPSGGPTIKTTEKSATSSEYLIKALQETGLIGRINIESNEVWVEESLWYSMNVSDKENVITLLSRYFNEKRGYERVTVYGWHTGKMLATMTLFGGIKFY